MKRCELCDQEKELIVLQISAPKCQSQSFDVCQPCADDFIAEYEKHKQSLRS